MASPTPAELVAAEVPGSPAAEAARDRRSQREIAAGSTIAVAGFILQQALQYSLFVAISRLWGAAGLGLFAMAQAILWVGGGMFRLGLSNGTVRFVAMLRGTDREGAIRPLLRNTGLVALLSSLVGGGLLFGSAGMLGRLLHEPDLVPLLRIFALAVPVWNLLFMSTFAFQGLRHMRWMVAVRNLAQPGLSLAAVATCGLLGASLVTGTMAYVASLAVVLVLAVVVLQRLLAGRPPSAPPPLREVLLYSFPLIWTQLVAYGVRQQEVLILGYFLPAADVGVYNAALKTSVLVGFILQGTHQIFAPVVASLHAAGEVEHLRRLNRTVARWCFTIALPAFLGCTLFGRQILSLWGPAFEAAWAPLVLLAGAQLVNVATGTAGTILIMGGRQKVELVNSVLALLTGLILDVLLIPPLGLLGAALGAVASMSAVNVLRVVQIHRLFGANPIHAKYLKPLGAGAVAAGLAFLAAAALERAGIGAWPQMMGGGGVLLASYVAVLWILRLEPDDVQVARALLRRRRGGRAAHPPAGVPS